MAGGCGAPEKPEKLGREPSPEEIATKMQMPLDKVRKVLKIAKELISLLQQETQIREMFRQNDYQITMNTKFQLGIKLLTKEPVETEAVAEVAG